MLNYVVPVKMNEAIKLLKSGKSKVTILGGGTIEMPNISAAPHEYSVILDISKLGLDKIKVSGAQVTIGAMVTLADVAKARGLGFLTATTETVGGPAIRNVGTIGGNIYHQGDLVAALIALEAKVAFHTSDGKSKLALKNMYSRGKSNSEILTSVTFKKPKKSKFGYYKFTRREHNAISVVTASVALNDKGKSVICLTGIAKEPVVITVSGNVFSSKFSHETVEEAVTSGLRRVKMKTDYHATGKYRKIVAPVVVRRAIESAA